MDPFGLQSRFWREAFNIVEGVALQLSLLQLDSDGAYLDLIGSTER